MSTEVELSCGHKVPKEDDYGGEALCPWCKVERSTVEQEVTYGEAVKAIAQEDPDAAGLLAEIMEANARDRESMLPSWADLDKAKQESYWLGYDAGKSAEARRLRNRIFGDPDDFEDA